MRRCLTAAGRCPGCGVYSNADALVDVARGFLDTVPEDRSGEDRTLVVVQVSAENLARDVADVPEAPLSSGMRLGSFGCCVPLQTFWQAGCEGMIGV